MILTNTLLIIIIILGFIALSVKVYQVFVKEKIVMPTTLEYMELNERFK